MFTNLDLQTAALSPRVCIAEKHGLQEPKYRLIDDLAKSLVNGPVESSETCCPQDIDSFVALSRLQTYYGPNQLRAMSVDFSHAYKTIALHHGPADASYICSVNPNANRPYKSRILVHPVGSRRAPATWGRVCTLIQFVALKLLYLTVGSFAGDLYCAEDRAVASSGFWACKQLCRLIGFNTSDRKNQSPVTDLALLGDAVPLHRDAIRSSAGRSRILKLRIHIAQALHLDCLTPAAASKLRGRLGFYTSLLMGGLGRGMLGPLITRQYRSRNTKLTRPLRRALVWWYNAVWSLPPRTTPFRLQPPFGDQSDAQCLGHIGCRVAFHGVSTSHAHLPEWFAQSALSAEGESTIYLFEHCAAILAACVVNELTLTNARSCVLRIDNQEALAALIKGSTSSELGTALVGGSSGR